MALFKSRLGFKWAILLLLVVFFTSCKSESYMRDDKSLKDISKSKALVVFVSDNIPEVREKAMLYGLRVKTIDSNSAAAQLIETLMQFPNDRYFVIVNPYLQRYIIGGSIPENSKNLGKLDDLFRKYSFVSMAGVKQLARLNPDKPGVAKLTIFSDFQCPYCKILNDFEPQWQKQFGNSLDIQLLNDPLPMHPQGFPAAEAAECARAQGAFEPYKEALFDNQRSLSEGTYVQIARNLELDHKKFSKCLTLHEQRKVVRQDQYFAEYLGVNGTPTMFLNGKQLNLESYDEVPALINQALGKAPAPSSQEKPKP